MKITKSIIIYIVCFVSILLISIIFLKTILFITNSNLKFFSENDTFITVTVSIINAIVSSLAILGILKWIWDRDYDYEKKFISDIDSKINIIIDFKDSNKDLFNRLRIHQRSFLIEDFFEDKKYTKAFPISNNDFYFLLDSKFVYHIFDLVNLIIINEKYIKNDYIKSFIKSKILILGKFDYYYGLFIHINYSLSDNSIFKITDEECYEKLGKFKKILI